MSIIDVWMRHPTLRHSNHQMFDSLKRWMGLPEKLEEAIPLEMTMAAMDEGSIDLDIPFCTQVGHTGPLRPSETGRPIPYIDQVALDFPELRIVCGHIGYPWTTEMIAVADKHPNVYIDTSAYAAHRYPVELVGCSIWTDAPVSWCRRRLRSSADPGRGDYISTTLYKADWTSVAGRSVRACAQNCCHSSSSPSASMNAP